ncbi:MAG: tetratricopeptide repeat protein [Planctomycetes bacterium]|nr:tetratricopeptide repeat protein [Planctomycetota bacterium]
MTKDAGHGSARWIAAALVALTLAVYALVGENGFVDFDDGAYVYDNPYVTEGLSLEGLGWAFTTQHSANWHPFTWLSHMLDVQIFDVEASAHHWVSVVLHAANAALLFLVLRAMTSATWRSAFVAAAFAVHPLHVESVAWIAERKDVLSTLFLLLTLGAYVRYVRAPTLANYVWVAAAFAAGLLSKPMLVTLPALLVLLDLWPLRRWSLGSEQRAARRAALLDKLPLLALSVLSSVATMVAQSGSGATGTFDAYPLGERVANALVSYVVYVQKTLWPTGLACFYPHPATIGASVELSAAVVAASVLVAATVLVIWQARRRPYLALGWLWYLGTLVPVIGLVQVGSQALADRYTYVPSIGLFVMLAWGTHELLEQRAGGRAVLAAGALASLGACATLTWRQVGVWRSSDTLYQHAIDVTDSNWLAWNNLGNQHLRRAERNTYDTTRRERDLRQALECFDAALRARSDYSHAWYNAGEAHLQLLEREQAVEAYRKSLELDDTNTDGWSGLGMAYLNLTRFDEARAACERALALDPRHAKALANLAFTYALQRDRGSFDATMQRLQAVDAALAANVYEQLRGTK